jgi:ATP-dependent helicase YprA (DUF1998 family)
MKLPNGHLAEFGSKIDGYCLNPNHNKGKHKARLFQSKLGINRNNSHILKQALREAAIDKSVTLRKQDEYGNHYTMKFRLTTAMGESLILAGWIVRQGENFPRLTSCYPVEK